MAARKLVQGYNPDGSPPWRLQSVRVSSRPAPRASPALSHEPPVAYASSPISCPYLKTTPVGQVPDLPSHNPCSRLNSLKTLNRLKEKQSNSLTAMLL